MSLILLFFSFSMLIVYRVFKRSSNSLTPGELFLIYWFLNLFIGLIIFHDFSWNGFAILYIIFAVLLFYIIEKLINNQKIFVVDKRKELIIDNIINNRGIIKIILIFSCILSFVTLFHNLKQTGSSIFYFFDINKLIDTSHQFSEYRYGKEEMESSFINQFCLATGYFGCIVSGFVFNFFNNKNMKSMKKYCFIIFLPITLNVLLTNAKTGLVMGGILWVSAYIVSLFFIKLRINIKFLIKISCICLSLFIILATSFYIRYGGAEFDYIINRMIVYAFGHIPGFSDWVTYFDITFMGTAFGGKSFNSIFRLLNLPISLTNTNELITYTNLGITNVHTLFSDLIIDFGLIGTLLFFVFLAIISGVLLNKLKYGKPLTITLLTLLNFVFLYSFLISPLKYISILVAFIEFYFFMIFVYYGRKIIFK